MISHGVGLSSGRLLIVGNMAGQPPEGSLSGHKIVARPEHVSIGCTVI